MPPQGNAGIGLDLLCIIGLVIVNLAVFSRSFGGYFLADDFVHVSWLYDVFNGHAGRLLENFTGNWMQAQGTQFYRPIISLTLAIDYLIGGASPNIFHVTNVALQSAASALLYMVTRLLMAGQGGGPARLVALCAGLFFAVCPLHPEVASWIIGRVDSVCLCFTLASLAGYLRWSQTGSKSAWLAAMITAGLALGSKEMAAVLPPVLVLAELSHKQEGSWQERLGRALRKTSAFWGLLVAYLALRAFALGSLVGGYNGSVGAGFADSLLRRFGDGSLWRLLFPFNDAVIGGRDLLRKLLSGLYIAAAATAGLRLAFTGRGRQFTAAGFSPLIFFASGWLVLSFLPALPVWNLTETLQCSRFAYAATAPLSLLAALLVLPVWTAFSSASERQKRLFGVAGIALAVALQVVLGLITYRNNIPWAHAAAQVKSFRQAVEQARHSDNRPLALLNVPNQTQGAHMVYNGAMLSVLLSPPLTKPSIAAISFEPVTFGDSELVNLSRLRRLFATQTPPRLLRWDEHSRRLEDVHVDCAIPDSQNLLTAPISGRRFVSGQLQLPCAGTEFIECEIDLPPGPQTLYLFWQGDKDSGFTNERLLARPVTNGGKQIVRFAVGEHKKWIASGKAARLCFEVAQAGGSGEAKLLSVRAMPANLAACELAPESLCEGSDGVVQLDKESTFRVDAGSIAGASACELEISPANSWFEHYSGTFKEDKRSPQTIKRIPLGRQAAFHLSPQDFPTSAYFQIRALAVNTHGLVVGYASDPINLQVSRH